MRVRLGVRAAGEPPLERGAPVRAAAGAGHPFALPCAQRPAGGAGRAVPAARRGSAAPQAGGAGPVGSGAVRGGQPVSR